jgi:hypothetical protein
MSQNTKIAPISIRGNPKKSTIIETFIAEPSANKEFLAGKIFILCEITGMNKNAEKIMSFLIDKINFFYYENDKILLREKLSSLKPEHILETALAKTNKAFQDFLKSEKIKNASEFLNITVGLTYENEIHFSLFGDNKIFLIYKQKAQGSSIDGEYKLIDLSAQSSDKEGSVFSNILSGTSPAQGGILVCNEALSEYLSNKQIIKIISTLPPLGAAEQIKNLLEKINNYISFCGIIIKESRSVKRPGPVVASPASLGHDSIRKLNSTEDTTEKILSPSGIFSLKNMISGLFSGLTNTRGPQTIVLKDKIYGQKRFLGFSRKIWNNLLNFLSYPVNLLYYLIKAIPKLNFNTLEFRAIGKTFNRLTWPKIISDFNWTKKRIFLFSVLLIITVFLVINISMGKKEQNEQAKNENFANLVSEIEKMQNQVDANLLYSNEGGARKLFDQINEKISALPQETEEQIAKYNEFNATFTEQLNKVRRITVINDPELVSDYSNIDDAADSSSLTYMGSKLYASDAKQKNFYITDINDSTVTTLAGLGAEINQALSPAITEKSIYYFNQDRILEFDTENKELSNLSFSVSPAGDNVIAIGTYNSRLYALSVAKNQILRYNRQNGNFGSAYSWLTDNADFSLAVDMFIDGHIYVLNRNGSVLKFLRGNTEEFKFEEVEPELSSPTKIDGSIEEGFLYVLEPLNRRLVVFDKKGQFVDQYQSDKFDDLRDFSVDEANRQIYVLNANRVYKFPVNE